MLNYTENNDICLRGVFFRRTLYISRLLLFQNSTMGMGMGIGNGGNGKNGNGNKVLSWEWEWVGMGMTSWEWEGMGTVKVIPAHL